MSHAPFIVAAYAVFLLVLAADAVVPWLARRRILARLRSRLVRERRRTESASPGTP